MNADAWKAFAYLYPTARPLDDYELRDDGNGVVYLAVWNLPGDPPTAQQIADAIAAYDAAQAAAAQQASQLRTTIRTLAAGTAGKSKGSLTASEVRALLAVLLWKAGAVASDGTVRPLDSWT